MTGATSPRCSNCGAPLPAGSWTCPYCKAAVDPAHAGMPSLAAVAGLVQANARSFEEAVPGLVAALDEALPGSVQVERGGGLLRRGDRIRSVSVLVGEYRFVLARRANRLEPTIHHEVRGVALKHDAVSPAEWLQRLGVQLRELAASTGPVNPAIGHLLRMP